MNSQPMGRIENGAAAQYDFSISAVLKEAWANVSGFKKTAWGGFGILLVAYVLATIVIGLLTGGFSTPVDPNQPHPLRSVLDFVRTLILYPMFVGYAMIGIKRAVNLPIRSMMVFDYYHCFARIAGVFILVSIVIFIPFLLTGFFFAMGASVDNLGLMILYGALGIVFLLLGIYFAYSYLFAAQLVAEKKIGIWAAMEMSRKAVTQHWFKVFFTFLCGIVIVLLSVVLALVGLIWTIPFSLALNGVLYKTLFGVEEAR